MAEKKKQKQTRGLQRSSTSEVEKALKGQRKLWKPVASLAISQAGHAEKRGRKPGRIWLIGEGSSRSAAEVSVELLRDLPLRKAWRGAQVFARSAAEVLAYPHWSSEDWVVGITHRGGTKTVATVLDQASQAGACILRVVSADAPAVLPAVESLLLTGPLEKVEPHTQALTTAVCAVTSFFAEPKVARDFWDQASRRKDPRLATLLNFLKRNFGMKSGPAIVLGHGRSEVILRELQLKLLEMARHPTWFFSSETFFHGPQWALANKARPLLWWRDEAAEDPRSDDLLDWKCPVLAFGSESGKRPHEFFESLVLAHWFSLAVAIHLGTDPDAGGMI
jgi:fructoselysine-6-P-deglycase FrlB-like protein